MVLPLRERHSNAKEFFLIDRRSKGEGDGFETGVVRGSNSWPRLRERELVGEIGGEERLIDQCTCAQRATGEGEPQFAGSPENTAGKVDDASLMRGCVPKANSRR